MSIPEEVRPHKDQPFYHLLAENAESEYVAYVSEQNLLPDDSGEPIRHSQVAEIFVKDKSGGYRPRNPVELTNGRTAVIRCFTTKKAPDRAPFHLNLAVYFAAGLACSPPAAGSPQASSAALRRASAALPAASSGFPRTPSGRSADRHRPWRIRRQRQRQRQRRAVGVDRLHDEVLALLHAREQFRRRLVVGHAAVLEADHIGALLRLVAVDDDAGAVDELHAERQGHAQDLLRLAFRLDDDGGDHRLAELDAAVLAGEADLLGAGVLALEAELGPGRVDQLNLLLRGLLGGGGAPGRRAAGCRGLLGRGSRGCSAPPCGAALGAALGAAAGAPGAGAGVWAAVAEASSAADKVVAANKAKTRPRGRTEVAKIRKFIAENPF